MKTNYAPVMETNDGPRFTIAPPPMGGFQVISLLSSGAVQVVEFAPPKASITIEKAGKLVKAAYQQDKQAGYELFDHFYEMFNPTNDPEIGYELARLSGFNTLTSAGGFNWSLKSKTEAVGIRNQKSSS